MAAFTESEFQEFYKLKMAKQTQKNVKQALKIGSDKHGAMNRHFDSMMEAKIIELGKTGLNHMSIAEQFRTYRLSVGIS